MRCQICDHVGDLPNETQDNQDNPVVLWTDAGGTKQEICVQCLAAVKDALIDFEDENQDVGE